VIQYIRLLVNWRGAVVWASWTQGTCGMLAPAAAPRLELVARTPGGAGALGEMERWLTDDEDSLALARIDLARKLLRTAPMTTTRSSRLDCAR
jgi:hypothetical protein